MLQGSLEAGFSQNQLSEGFSPNSLLLGVLNALQNGRLGAGWSGRVPGSRLACLPLPFICLPLLFNCLPGWVLVVGFPAGLSPTSLHLSPTFSPSSLLLGVLNSFLRCVRAGDATFLFICLPGLSLVVSALFCRRCSILFICPPGLSPVVSALFCCFHCWVSALFRWPCSISIHLSPRSVTASVRSFPLAMQHFDSSPRSVTAGVRPCPLVMQHFYACVSQACHW